MAGDGRGHARVHGSRAALGLDVDARADQFSFCVALYQGLYGERPFQAKTITQVFAEIEGGRVRPAPPESDVPARIRRVVLRGLAPNPSHRWPSMGALLDALGGRRAHSHPAVLAGVGVIALGAAGAMVWLGDAGDACEAGLGDVWGPVAGGSGCRTRSRPRAWATPSTRRNV